MVSPAEVERCATEAANLRLDSITVHSTNMGSLLGPGPLLRSQRLTNILIALHVIMLVGVVFLPHVPSVDEPTYLALAQSIENGGFSVWGDHYDPAPVDTHRTHGYPMFILVLLRIYDSITTIFVAQALLFFTTLLLVLHVVRHHPQSTLLKNVFLLAMLPQLQLLHYVGQVFPEVLMSFLCSAIALSYHGERESRWMVLLRIVLLAGAFWVRPVMLLFPAMVLVADLFVLRGPLRWSGLRSNAKVLVGAALLGPVPFAYWNFVNHGVPKPVPISGSAVFENMGIWQLRLPGYGTMHYFQHSSFGREFIPWVNGLDAHEHYASYQEQWARIHAEADPYKTAEDRARLPLMMTHPQRFAARSAPYSIALNRAIAKENMAMIKAEPFYYCATRLYTSVRLWVTNINLPMKRIVYRPTPGRFPLVRRPEGIVGWSKTLLPFIITFMSFGLGLPYLTYMVVRGHQRWFQRRHLLYMIIYVWLIHVPMVIQSRYTVPVHVVAILCITFALTDRNSSGTLEGVKHR